ncbi:PIR protein [Plasmodium ovale]|uniref:PIR protein n=1 Tax=Plasmodium ovale TaxID=36330 RepID=A0A1D3JFY4_PLAOA|nr:PIR protein [Plasmodium ovale]
MIFLDDNKCETYIQDIKEITFSKLHNIIELHKTFNKFLESETLKKDCNSAKECANKYIVYADKCYEGNEYSFCNELERFRERYNNHVRNETCEDDVPKTLPSTKRFNIIVNSSILYYYHINVKLLKEPICYLSVYSIGVMDTSSHTNFTKKVE